MARKKTTAKPRTAKTTRRRAAAAPVALSPKERARLLKPVTNYEELTRRAVAAWRDHTSDVRVPGLTPARLNALLGRAERTQARETKIREAAEARIRAAQDARLTGDDRAYRALLDLRASAEVAGRRSPGVRSAFEFLIKALERPGRPTPRPEAAPAVTTPTA